SHQVQERAATEPERRPVEVVVRDEARVLLSARAREVDPVHDRVRSAWKSLERTERRQAHRRLASGRTRKRVRRCQDVVHLPLCIGRGGQYCKSEKTSYPSNRSRPFRNSSSMMNGRPTTSPPSCSTSSTVALAVPPVASTSSWIRTRWPFTIASACTSSESNPYSSAYFAATVRHGSLPGFLAATKPQPSRHASAPPVM